MSSRKDGDKHDGWVRLTTTGERGPEAQPAHARRTKRPPRRSWFGQEADRRRQGSFRQAASGVWSESTRPRKPGWRRELSGEDREVSHSFPGRDVPWIPPELADPDGFVGVGGDLSPRTLLRAYAEGVFPWFNEDDPILWWSPDPARSSN